MPNFFSTPLGHIGMFEKEKKSGCVIQASITRCVGDAAACFVFFVRLWPALAELDGVLTARVKVLYVAWHFSDQ